MKMLNDENQWVRSCGTNEFKVTKTETVDAKDIIHLINKKEFYPVLDLNYERR